MDYKSESGLFLLLFEKIKHYLSNSIATMCVRLRNENTHLMLLKCFEMDTGQIKTEIIQLNIRARIQQWNVLNKRDGEKWEQASLKTYTNNELEVDALRQTSNIVR